MLPLPDAARVAGDNLPDMLGYVALVAGVTVAGLAGGWPQGAVISRFTGPSAQLTAGDAVPAPEAGAVPEPQAAHEAQAALEGQPTGRTAQPVVVSCVSAVLLGALAVRLRPGPVHPGLVHPGLVLAAACWLALCSVPLAFIDVKVHRLPDALTGAAAAGTAGLLALAAAAPGGTWSELERAMLGGRALPGCYLLLLLISPSGMGFGDLLTELRRRSPQAADVTERCCFPSLWAVSGA